MSRARLGRRNGPTPGSGGGCAGGGRRYGVTPNGGPSRPLAREPILPDVGVSIRVGLCSVGRRPASFETRLNPSDDYVDHPGGAKIFDLSGRRTREGGGQLSVTTPPSGDVVEVVQVGIQTAPNTGRSRRVPSQGLDDGAFGVIGEQHQDLLVF